MGDDVNITINNKNALLNACTNYWTSTGNLEIMKLLFSHNIDPNVRIRGKRIVGNHEIFKNIFFRGGPISEIIELFMRNGFNIYENKFYDVINNMCSSSNIFDHHMPRIMSVQKELLLKKITKDILPTAGGNILLYKVIVDYSTPSS